MEAPEKIYRTTTYLDSGRGKTVWKNKPVPGAENVEYTRTDAFIEKAYAFLKDRIAHDSIDYPMATNSLIEDFKKYMEE